MAPKILTDKQKEELISLYKQNLSLKEIGDKIGILPGSVTRIIRKLNIDRNLKRINDADLINHIIDQYNSNISSEKISENLNISSSTVRRVLERNGIKIRSHEECHRKYDINQDYFEVIDTESKAYFLGFIYADGSLSSKSGAIRIELGKKDIDILEKFSKEIYGFIKIGDDGDDKYVDVYSLKMHRDLIKLNCTPNKTFTIEFPSFLRNDLIRHFIRGYFDGDGHIRNMTIKDKNRPVLDITSNFTFISGLKKCLEDQFGFIFTGNIRKDVRRDNPNRENPTASIQIASIEGVFEFLNFIYNDSAIYMDRKYNSYLDYLTYYKFNRAKIIERKDGKLNYYIDGIPLSKDNYFSKLNNPKMISLSGYQKMINNHYYFNGKYIVENFCEFNYVNNKLHNETGPAVKYNNGDKYWYLNGNLHRVDGPAIIYHDFEVEYYINGIMCKP